MNIPRRFAIVAAAVGIGAGALLSSFIVSHWRSSMHRQPPVMPAGQKLESAQLERLSLLPPFQLQQQGGPFTPAYLRGRWSFVYFGYTNCPEACPTTLSMLRQVQIALRKQGLTPPRIVFISVDPRRDTPQLLARYVANFGKDTLAATGDDDALHELTPFFGVNYQRNDSQDKLHYSVDHSALVFLITPDDRWLAAFPPLADTPQVAHDTAAMMKVQWD